MATSAKIRLRRKPNKEGLFPLVVRITKNRKSSFIYTGQYIDEKFWNEKKSEVKKTHPNSKYLNNLLITKLAEANDTLLNLEREKNVISSTQVKKEIINPISQTTFKEFAEEYLSELEVTHKLKRHSSDKTRIRHFNTFVNDDFLTFQNIDENLLNRFSLYLKTKRKQSERTVVNNLIVIRTLFNRAVREGIVDAKRYPFGKGKIQLKFPETEKPGLSKEEIIKLESREDLNQEQDHARNIWLTSFYFGGIRLGDVLRLKWTDIYDGRLHYRMGKNKKLVSLKVSDKAQKVFDKYLKGKKTKNQLIFPDLANADFENPKDVYRIEKKAHKYLNAQIREAIKLLKIEKRIGFHSARHSFAHLSGEIDVRQLQKIFRHSNLSTTINYMESISNVDTDDALDKVTGF